MYFYVDELNGAYTIMMTSTFYNYVRPYYKDGASYLNVFYRLYNLLPYDFYHYVAMTYNASYQKSTIFHNFVKMIFKEKKDAARFCDDLNKRFQYCVDNNFFKDETI